MQSFKCIIVEDEPLAAKVLKDYILQIPQLELTGTFKNAISAAIFLQQSNTDIIFLDIHLPEIKGFDFLRTLAKPPAVVVTTAYHQYALEAFDLNVADYLLKPISFPRFLAAVNKATKAISLTNNSVLTSTTKEYSIFLTINRKKTRIVLDDILYIESKKEYIQIFTKENTFVCKMGTSDFEKMLPARKFKRIHRSFIVATDKISSYTKESIELRGKTIPIGKSFRKDFSI